MEDNTTVPDQLLLDDLERCHEERLASLKRIAALEAENTRLRLRLRKTTEEAHEQHGLLGYMGRPFDKPGVGCCHETCSANRAALREAALAPEPARWYERMREAPPYAMAEGPLLCWRYLAEETVCILERGHDDGTHEPESDRSDA